MNPLPFQALAAVFRRSLIFGVFIFAAAWTLDYAEAWAFLGVFFLSELLLVLWLLKNDRTLLERRLKSGPKAENRPRQKILMTLAQVSFFYLILVAGWDHRRHWSHVPLPCVVAADALTVLGFFLTLRVFRENTFAAATVRMADGQRVIATGPYAIVRHPMYSAAVLLNFCAPVALGSWWALTMPLANLGIIIARLRDEEAMLRNELPGYADYCGKVRHRLIPFIW